MELLLLASVGFGVAKIVSGSISEASAVQAQTEFQTDRLITQERLEDLKAESAITRGRDAEAEQKIKVKLLIGRQRARLSAQGIEIDSGSALDIQLETAEFGAADALTIRNNAFREATGHRIQAIDFRNQAQFAKLSGQNVSGNTLLTGGLTAATELTRGFAALKT